MGSTKDLSSRINESYRNLSKGQKKLASYITDNYDKAVFFTAAKLGETVGVSESTVVRFAAHLGYKGYPEFQNLRLKIHIFLLLSLDRADHNALCEELLQEGVDTDDRQYGNRERRHFDSGGRQVASAQVRGGHLFGRGAGNHLSEQELQRTQVLIADVDDCAEVAVPVADCVEHSYCGDDCHGQRQHDIQEHSQLSRAIDRRRFLDLLRHALKEVAHEEYVERIDQAGQNQRP